MMEGVVGSKDPQLPVPLSVEVSQGQLHVWDVDIRCGVDCSHIHMDQTCAVTDRAVFIGEVLLSKPTLVLNGIKVSNVE